VYYGAQFAPQDAFLAFELVDGGGLSEYLDRRKGAISAEEALAIFEDVIRAVAHLHAQSPPIACRDLKLENVLYDRLQKRFKLCDFGSCTTVAKRYVDRRELTAAEDEVQENSSAMYRAPELCGMFKGNADVRDVSRAACADLRACCLWVPDLFGKAFVCEKVDVWAAGCVWFAILYGALPFDGQSTIPILQGKVCPPPNPPRWPPSFQKLCDAMLTVSVSRRADSFAILEAVCRLRGKEMDDELRQIGAGLRERRRRDFDAADDGSSSAAITTAARTPGLASNTAPPATPPFVFGATGLAAASTSTAPGVGVAGAAGSLAGADEGWADFDSAEMAASPAPAPQAIPQAAPTMAAVRQPVDLDDFFGFSAAAPSLPSALAPQPVKPAEPSGSSAAPTSAAPTPRAAPPGPAPGSTRPASSADLFADLLPAGFGR
jgi:Protein kinase domain